jgi:DNA-directed RNA polymerase specialized sigma subunit
MTALTRRTKEMLVLDLYYNQDKTYRQIAKEAKICPRDIKTIIDKKTKEVELSRLCRNHHQYYKISQSMHVIGYASE